LNNYEWTRAIPKNEASSVPLPSEKAAAWMSNEDTFTIFGGYGNVRHHAQDDVELNPYSVMGQDWGWNNGLASFDFNRRTWTRLKTSGVRPRPRAGSKSNTPRCSDDFLSQDTHQSWKEAEDERGFSEEGVDRID